MDLKSSLKTIKLHEPVISAVLGALIVVSIAYLTFNYFRSKPQGQISTGIQTENTQVANPTKHTVIKGDSLWKIAEAQYKSGFAWVDIAKANNLKNPDNLVEGQELILPEVQVKETQIPNDKSQINPETDTGLQNQKTISGDKYTVVNGDSLWKIAVRAYGDGYRWSEIAKLNNLKNPNLIYPNNELKLPPKS